MAAARTRPDSQDWGDRLCRWACLLAALAIPCCAVLLIVVLAAKASLAFSVVGLGFLTSAEWNVPAAAQWEAHRLGEQSGAPKSIEEDDLFSGPKSAAGDVSKPPPLGALAFIFGTLASSALAMLLAVPLGVGTAAFLSEIASPPLRKFGATLVEMLAAVPSVVYGFWGAVVLGPALNSLTMTLGGPNFGGVGLFPASVILGIMVLPYVCAVSFDVCRSVPRAQREAAFALGATRWQVVRTAVLPYARPGILAGSFIALGRALGETMAVTMLIGNTPVISLSLFTRASTIPSVIANELPNANFDLHRSALMAMGLILLLVTMLVNVAGRWLLARRPTGLSQGRGAAASASWSARLLSPFVPRSLPALHFQDRVMRLLLRACFVATLVPLFLILAHILWFGASGLSWNFFTKLPAPQGETGGGLAHALVGSLVLVGIATILAVPLGLMGGIFLAEYKSRWSAPIRFVVELMSGVPSILVGVFAYVLIIEGRNSHFGWAGAFALAVMMLPIIIRTSEEALRLVPSAMRHASLALGASHLQTLVRVTVPSAAPAILTAIFLGISRVIGETAPLLLTAGSNSYWPQSLNDYYPSIPGYIYYYATNADVHQQQQAWAAALVLMAMVLTMNYGIRMLTGSRVIQAAHGE